MAGSPTTRRQALRGLRLAGDPRRRRPRRRSRSRRAIDTALKSTDKPTLICCRTTIGFGSPNKAGKESCARRAAGQGRNRRHARGAGLAARAVRDPAGNLRRLARGRRRRACAKTSGTRCSTQYAAQLSRTGRRTRAPLARRAAGRLRRRGRCLHREAAGRRPGRRLAQGLADGASKPSRRCCRN